MVSYILRECFVTSAMHLVLMASGVALSFPSILVPALKAEHPDVAVTEDKFNHIMRVYFLASPLGYLVFSWTMQRFGRKLTNVLLNVSVIAGSVTIAVASNATLLIIGRAFHGLSLAGYYIGCTMAAEYTHPRRRGFYIVIKGVSESIGELLCHTLGLTILTYRQTALMAVVPAVLSILVTLRWPESPQYLAYKGRYDECTSAFEWLRGTDSEAKKELQVLILSQKNCKRQIDREQIVGRCREAVGSKEFWMPLLLIALCNVGFIASGYLYMVTYTTEILNMITGDRYSALFYTIILDLMKMSCIIISSVIVRLVKRRSLLFSSGSAASAVLIAFCVMYHFTKTAGTAVKWVTLSLYITYYVIVNITMAPIAVVIQSELLPLKYKGVGTFLSGMIIDFAALAFMTITSKVMPVLDLNGTFGIYLISFAICYVILFFFLPETKDKTLQDIENFFTSGSLKYDSVNLDVDDKLVAGDSDVKL